MGGRALTKTLTKRCSRKEFDMLSIELTDILKRDFKCIGIPMFYNKKETFGDIDIVASMDEFTHNMNDYITDRFNPNEIFHNGNCWSFDYKETQIDIITVAPEHFDSLIHYMNFNDLGNLVGRLAHHKGVKYGEMGLWLEHYFKDMNIGKIILSKDQRKIYDFLGLDYDRYLKGFDELTDIFKFITKSKYFDWRLYQLHNLNKVNRERNLKRKSYISFLEWIDTNVRDDKDVNEELLKDFSLEEIDKAFPEANVMTEIRRLEYEECKKLYIKAKFNGGEVMRKYGLEGKVLGDAMSGFKEFINGLYGNYNSVILDSDENRVYTSFEYYLSINPNKR